MALRDDVRNLSLNPTLGKLEPEALQLIAFSAETRILRAGDTVFRKGEVSDGGYVVLSGAVVLDDGSGRETIARPPALLGDIALIAETARPCSATVREASNVLKISRALFHRVLTEFPVSAARLRQTYDKRVTALRDDLAKLHGELG